MAHIIPIGHREIEESPVRQGKNEKVTYIFDFTGWDASEELPVTSPDVNVFDQDGTDVTSTVLVASPTVVDSVQVSFQIWTLTPDIRYRVNVAVTIGDEILEPYMYIDAED